MHPWLISAAANFKSARLIQKHLDQLCFSIFLVTASASQQPFSALQTHLSCAGQQMSAGHPQIRQGK